MAGIARLDAIWRRSDWRGRQGTKRLGEPRTGAYSARRVTAWLDNARKAWQATLGWARCGGVWSPHGWLGPLRPVGIGTAAQAPLHMARIGNTGMVKAGRGLA